MPELHLHGESSARDSFKCCNQSEFTFNCCCFPFFKRRTVTETTIDEKTMMELTQRIYDEIESRHFYSYQSEVSSERRATAPPDLQAQQVEKLKEKVDNIARKRVKVRKKRATK